MKKLVLLFIAMSFLTNTHLLSAEKEKNILQKLFSKYPPASTTSKSNPANTTSKSNKAEKEKNILQKLFSKYPPASTTLKSTKSDKNLNSEIISNDTNQNILVYTGTFDTIDKEGDDKTTLVGIEHKNKNLFRDTWLGTFSPTSGAFVTKKSSVYLYSGIEADYNLGPINISPSFAPGYYEAGDGKNLGSALEFKSEIKIGVDLFKNSNLGYSYSHISNNDWGDVNPGTDNQSLTFSKKF